MRLFSDWIASLTDEVCRADYLSLRKQEEYIMEMAKHKAPIPGEGYLSFMAANEIELQLHLKKSNLRWFERVLQRLGKSYLQGYELCKPDEAELSFRVVYRRPASSPLLSANGGMSQHYDYGKPLANDWETQIYVID